VKFLLFFFLLISTSLEAKYLDNHSCAECHEKIYEEFQSSRHSHGYFNDELHQKIADKVSDTSYTCATCHMPMADNINDLILGKARPDKNNKTHTDAISCYFCHTIAYVKKSHKFNINTKARQADGYKPTLYGRLSKPDDSDKHSSVKNPVYAKNVCLGCHSHKLNDNNVTIFRAMKKGEDSLSCINCHMPEVAGGVEKMDKRARGQHASHKFLGIHDKTFRATGVDINISTKEQHIMIRLTNKMAHPLIIQPARVKYMEVTLLRDGKEIWKNFKNHPSEDAKAFFELTFQGEDAKQVIIPAKATASLRINNLQAKETKQFIYHVPSLKPKDMIEVSMKMRVAKEACQKEVTLSEALFVKEILLKRVTYVVE
jgi:hypothetical protein